MDGEDDGGADDVDEPGEVAEGLVIGVAGVVSGSPDEPPFPHAIPPQPPAMARTIDAMPRLRLMTTAILDAWGNAGRTLGQRSGYGFR
jgi:hypothetical protein